MSTDKVTVVGYDGSFVDTTPSSTGYAYISPGTPYAYAGPVPESALAQPQSVRLLGVQPVNNYQQFQPPTPPPHTTPPMITNTEHPPGVAQSAYGGHLKIDPAGVIEGASGISFGVGLSLYPSRLPGVIDSVATQTVETFSQLGGKPVQSLVQAVSENPAVARGMEAYRSRLAGSGAEEVVGTVEELEPLLGDAVVEGATAEAGLIGVGEAVGTVVAGIVSAPVVALAAGAVAIGIGAYEIGKHVSWGGETLNQHVSQGFKEFERSGHLFGHHL